MRYLRRQTLNRRAVYDNTLYVDTTNAVVMGSRNNVKLPSGSEAERPVSPLNGMMRYNETSLEVEVYQGSTWRALRYKEAGEIVQQTVGVGDGDTIYFGPLNPAPPAISQSGYTWTGSNLMVVVENVLQLHTTNYTVVQNPTFGAESYTGNASEPVTVGSTVISFNTSVLTAAASGNGTTATITIDSPTTFNPFSIGETILVAGVTPYAYNGEHVVTAVTDTTVSFVSTATGSLTVQGSITAESAIWPAIDIVGATVSGHAGIAVGTTVDSYDVDPNTGALTFILLSQPTAGSTIPVGTAITIAEGSQVGTGYYLKFGSPVPPGKPVTVLHGFDK